MAGTVASDEDLLEILRQLKDSILNLLPFDPASHNDDRIILTLGWVAGAASECISAVKEDRPLNIRRFRNE